LRRGRRHKYPTTSQDGMAERIHQQKKRRKENPPKHFLGGEDKIGKGGLS